MGYYKSELEIIAVVEGFESCATPAADFSHRSHLTVAVWYLSRQSLPEALRLMRANLFRFIDHHQVSRRKYNETITVFWLRLVRLYLDQLVSGASLLEATNAVVEALCNTEIMFDYFTRERLWSEAARHEWIEPDLRPLAATGK